MDKDLIYSAIFSSVVGDALGVPYEFTDGNDCSGMIGFGTYNQEVGTWSDDTSLTLALLDSLANGDIDYNDIMDNFLKWFYEGEYTCDGDVFDIGIATRKAIVNYEIGSKPLDSGLSGFRDNGNGSLMRIMPIILYLNHGDYSEEEQIRIISEVSSLTHAHKISTSSCNIYNFVLQEIINNKHEKTLQELIKTGLDKSRKYFDNDEYSVFKKLYNDNFFDLDISEIGSTGFVVDSLEVALWSGYNSSDYHDALIEVVRLGGDTDTNAMITGGLIGTYYGLDSIPSDWLSVIRNKELIYRLCDNFYDSLIRN